MKVIAFLKLSALAVILSGCAVYKAEKQKHIALLSAGAIPEKGVSGKEWLRRGNLGAQAANRTGADMGMAALMLLNSVDFQKAAAKQDHLEAWMPLSEARDEQDKCPELWKMPFLERSTPLIRQRLMNMRMRQLWVRLADIGLYALMALVVKTGHVKRMPQFHQIRLRFQMGIC